MKDPIHGRSVTRSIPDRSTKEYAQRLEDEGFEIRRLNGGHFAVEWNGERIAIFGGTRPDHCALRNLDARVRRWKRERGFNPGSKR